MRMFTITAAVVALVAGTVALALPASAAGVSSCRSEKMLNSRGVLVERVDLFAKTIAIQLRQRGYDVDTVQSWGGCVKAYINDPGGGSHMAFFDPDTLAPLDPNS